MIARIWRGWAPADTADAYQDHYATEVREHLASVPGFAGARLLRGEEAGEVMFTSITFFTTLEAVQGFAGEHYEDALVEEGARRVLSHWDETVTHQEVAVDVPAN